MIDLTKFGVTEGPWVYERAGFEQWWHKHGSSVRPTEGCDCEEHGRRVAALAWNEATAAEKERCARIAEGVERTEERHWIPGSLYDTLRRETAAEIRREHTLPHNT